MRMTVYVPLQKAVEKIKYARSLAETVYIGAATGYGKTELIRQYLKSRNYIYVSCDKDEWTIEALQSRIL